VFTPVMLVVEIIPFRFDLNMTLFVEVDNTSKVLLLITEEVAITPLIFVVKVFPDRV